MLTNNYKKKDINEIFQKYLLDFKGLYLLCISLSLLVGIIYLRYTPFVYEVSTTLLIKSEEENMPNAPSEDLILRDLGIPTINRNLENEMFILKSETLMKEVIHSLQLQIQYLAKGKISTTELFPNAPITCDSANFLKPVSYHFHHFSNGSHFDLYEEEQYLGTFRYDSLIQTPHGKFRFHYHAHYPQQDFTPIIKFFSVNELAAAFAEKIKVKQEGNATILKLSLTTMHPEKAATLLNSLIAHYNEAASEEKKQVSINTHKFLDGRINMLATELHEIESELESYQENRGLPNETSHNYFSLFNHIKELENEQLSLSVKIQELKSLHSAIESAKNHPATTPLPYGKSIVFGLDNILNNYNDLLIKKQELEKKLSERHPELVAINKQMQSLTIAALHILEEHHQVLENLYTQINQRIINKKAAIKNRPRQERELTEMTRKRKIKEELFLYLLNKREETALSMSVSPTGSRVIDKARKGDAPISPQKSKVLLTALFIGAALPAFFIYVYRLFDNHIHSEIEIKNNSGLPLIGVINYDKRAPVLNHIAGNNEAAERFRLLRTNLHFFVSNNKKKRFLITSLSSQEGKTFIAINLGYSLAVSGKKTILVGMDLRRPLLSAYLKERRPIKGISHFFAGTIKAEEIIFQTSINPNLFFADCGVVPPNPAELLSNEKLSTFFSILDASFDYIIIDSPPVGMVTDAQLLSTFATLTMFVVRKGKTPLSDLSKLEEFYQRKIFPNPALVLNGIPASSHYGRTYYRSNT